MIAVTVAFPRECSRLSCVLAASSLRVSARTFFITLSYMSDQTPLPLGGDEPAPPAGGTAPDGLVTPGQPAGLYNSRRLYFIETKRAGDAAFSPFLNPTRNQLQLELPRLYLCLDL